jgi:hypothetical protein
LKVIKLLIWLLIITILLLVAIFGIDTGDGGGILPETENEQAVQSDEGEAPESSEPTTVTIPTLTAAERAVLPDFIKAMPQEATEGDWDGNWLRDDLELFIAYKFPQSPMSRAVYIQLSKVLDRIATDGGQTKDARQVTLWRDELYALKCFYQSGFTDEELEELRSFIFNNAHRREGYEEVERRREALEQDLKDSIVIPENTCDPIILENERSLQEWVPE